VGGALHDEASEGDGIGGAPHGCHGAGTQCLPIHDGGIQFYFAAGIRDGATAGIEVACLFQSAHSQFHHIQRCAPRLKLLVGFVYKVTEESFYDFGFIGGEVVWADVTGAAVDSDSNGTLRHEGKGTGKETEKVAQRHVSV
jgi:hypothetical protein